MADSKKIKNIWVLCNDLVLLTSFVVIGSSLIENNVPPHGYLAIGGGILKSIGLILHISFLLKKSWISNPVIRSWFLFSIVYMGIIVVTFLNLLYIEQNELLVDKPNVKSYIWYLICICSFDIICQFTYLFRCTPNIEKSSEDNQPTFQSTVGLLP